LFGDRNAGKTTLFNHFITNDDTSSPKQSIRSIWELTWNKSDVSLVIEEQPTIRSGLVKDIIQNERIDIALFIYDSRTKESFSYATAWLVNLPIDIRREVTLFLVSNQFEEARFTSTVPEKDIKEMIDLFEFEEVCLKNINDAVDLLEKCTSSHLDLWMLNNKKLNDTPPVSLHEEEMSEKTKDLLSRAPMKMMSRRQSRKRWSLDDSYFWINYLDILRMMLLRVEATKRVTKKITRNSMT
jgi:GTPase SAR1 family protein